MSNSFPILCTAVLCCLVFQACDDITYHDMVLQSASRMPLPIGPVHVPPRDTDASFQASFAVSQGRGGNAPIALTSSGASDQNLTEVDGPAGLTVGPTQLSGSLSIFPSEHIRLGAGVEGSSQGSAGWVELGLRFGRELSVETFADFGKVKVRSQVSWEFQTNDPEDGGSTPSSQQTSSSSENEGFYRFGFHVARRAGGPWAELQITNTGLFESPRTSDGGLSSPPSSTWGTTLFTTGAGWAQPSPMGTWIAFVRATNTGVRWIPQAGLQWTGEIGLSR